MFILSSKTRQARKKLEEIRSEEFQGKELLKNFLERDLKSTFTAKSDAKAVMNAAQEPKSNIYKFAALLDSGNNMGLFKKAIELQAKSLGTKEKGLFYNLIYQNRNGNWLNLKSKIKAFLLAKDSSDIADEEVESDDKKLRRMKKPDIVEKLKSKRLSNVLKVFMALVMWDYIIIKAEKKRKEETGGAERKRIIEEAIEAEGKLKKGFDEAEKKRKEEEERKRKEDNEAEKKRKEEERKRKEDNEAEKKRKEEEERKRNERWAEGRLTKEEFENLTDDDKKKLTKLVIPDEIEEIPDRAFTNCPNLKTVIFGKNVEYIGESAFMECTSLGPNIKLPESVRRLRPSAFYGCRNLVKINIPKGITDISRAAFFQCEKLKEVKMEDGIERIHEGAFFGCSSLYRVTIPKSVKFIDENAFKECSSLQVINAEESTKRMDSDQAVGVDERKRKENEETTEKLQKEPRRKGEKLQENAAANPNQKGRYAGIDRTKKISKTEFYTLYARQGINETALKGNCRLIAIQDVALDEKFITSIMERRYAHLKQVEWGIEHFIEKMDDKNIMNKALDKCISELTQTIESDRSSQEEKERDQKKLEELQNIKKQGGIKGTGILKELKDLIDKILKNLSSNPEDIPSVTLSSNSIKKINDVFENDKYNTYMGYRDVKENEKCVPFMATSDEPTDRILATLEALVYDGGNLTQHSLENFCIEIESIPDVFSIFLNLFEINRNEYPPSKNDKNNPYRGIYGVN